MRPAWHFDYAPARPHPPEPTMATDVIVATVRALDPARATALLASLGVAGLVVETLIDRAPLHWLRVRADAPVLLRDVGVRVTASGAEVRYVASACEPSQQLPPALPLDRPPAAPTSWRVRHAPIGSDPVGPGAWYLGDRGLNVDRAQCGYGVGARVAIIDSDAGKTPLLGLDALVAVGRSAPDPRRNIYHGATCVAWAVGVEALDVAGVAPGGSARLYCIPKAGSDVFAFPTAIVQATADGADVIACATYVDETMSPMLDDALTFARHYGRQGAGTAVILAASREMSSPEGRVRASLSLDLGDPASDPRVFCAAASGSGGGWFLWRDRCGELQPFSNRGPAVHFMAPGDDVADPFAPGRVTHAESSGATAFAAGVVALVLAHNPSLQVGELGHVLRGSCRAVDGALDRAAAAERTGGDSELGPYAVDRDGHNAKHGYGRLDATVACLTARDPVALVLVGAGERAAMTRWAAGAGLAGRITRATQLAACRALLVDTELTHAARVIVRHLRLIADEPSRWRAHAPGSLARHVTLLLRTFAERLEGDAALELSALASALVDATKGEAGRLTFELALSRVAAELWPTPREQAGWAAPADEAVGSHEAAGPLEAVIR